jgi:NAD(P)-dependent dehydrogenase (short-subunit alcohol dehydrogenase family)
MFCLIGHVAVITGGAGALGLGVGQALLSLGADVVLLGRSKERLDTALASLSSDGPSASIYVCDVCDEDALKSVCDRVLGSHGKLDILVTCAAAPAASGKFDDITLEEWRAMMSTDLDGVFLACKTFGKPMISRGYGRIVNLTSFHNVATYPFRTAYNAAKSGVEGLSRGLAVEWGHHGITVNTIAPGPILTPRTRWFLSQDDRNEAGMLGRTPNVRLGEVSDLSSAVAFLASEEAGHINGQRLVIDGGWTKNAWWGKYTDL